MGEAVAATARVSRVMADLNCILAEGLGIETIEFDIGGLKKWDSGLDFGLLLSAWEFDGVSRDGKGDLIYRTLQIHYALPRPPRRCRCHARRIP